jgi:hypothetical protein
MAAVRHLATETFAAARTAFTPTWAAKPGTVLRAHSLCAFPSAALLARTIIRAGARSGRQAAATLEAAVEETTRDQVTGLAGFAIRATNEATVVRADSGGVTQQAIATRRDVRQRLWCKIGRGSFLAAANTLLTDVAVRAGVTERSPASAGMGLITIPTDATKATTVAGSRVTPAGSPGGADRRLRRAVLTG